MKKIILLLALLPSSIFGYSFPSVPNTFIAGSVIYSSEVNQNFNALVSGLNSSTYKIAPAEVYSGTARVIDVNGNMTPRGLTVSDNATVAGTLTVKTRKLYVSATKVGIDTLSPQRQFSVSGDMQVTGSVYITGTTAAAGITGTTISASGKFTSTVAGGTAPFHIKSSTVVPTLNVDMLDGKHWSDIPSGNVTGNGTTNTVPKFISSGKIGNSGISDSGTLITVSPNMHVTGYAGIGVANNSAYALVVQAKAGVTDTFYGYTTDSGASSSPQIKLYDIGAYGETRMFVGNSGDTSKILGSTPFSANGGILIYSKDLFLGATGQASAEKDIVFATGATEKMRFSGSTKTLIVTGNISMSTGNITVPFFRGNISAQDASGSYTSCYNSRIFKLGTWDMDATTTNTVTVAGAVSAATTIVGCQIFIINDAQDTTTSFSDGGTFDIVNSSNTEIRLSRSASGKFDSADYNSTAKDRGWAIVWFVNYGSY